MKSFNEYLKSQNSFNENQNIFNDNFWKWFGDSKIIDNKGNPLKCFHGSNDSSFKKFNLELTGKNTDSGMFGKGFYFTNDEKYSSTYNRSGVGGVFSVFLSIRNPLIINDKKDIPKIIVPHETLDDMINSPEIYSLKFREYLIQNNYDGVIDNLENWSFKQYIALYPNQIKSIENDGTWDKNDDNIYS